MDKEEVKAIRKQAAQEILNEVTRYIDEAVPGTRELTSLLLLGGWIATKFGLEI